MGFRATLAASSAALTEADRRIGSILLAASDGALMMTAAQLAERAGVHESSVVRFAQKLGYAGYPSLRADLLTDVEDQRRQRHNRWRRKAEDYQLESIIEDQMAALPRLTRHISQETLDNAAKELLAADRVFIFGYGFMTPLVDFMERRLRQAGRSVVSVKHDGTELLEMAALIRPTDVLLIFAFEDNYRSMLHMLPGLITQGLGSVLVTDERTLMLETLPRHVIALPGRHEYQAVLSSLTVIAYALSYALTHLDPTWIAANPDDDDEVERS